jgi:hypothetical protein
MLHKATEKATMLTRLLRSASQAIGMPEPGVEERESEPAHQPELDVRQLQLLLDRPGRMPMICRSMKLKM